MKFRDAFVRVGLRLPIINYLLYCLILWSILKDAQKIIEIVSSILKESKE